jgi:regulator of sigma E protease
MELLSSLLSSLPSVVLTVLGIGLVIFVHEAGHFLAARWCGVRVDVFSIGFGPVLFAWKRGATQYQVAAIPLGGYVKMAGEDGPPGEDAKPDPDALPSKSVGQRFLIYSGGVIMNVLFGLVVFPILFAVGVTFLRPVVGEASPGSPAWHARIPAGTEVLSVDGRRTLEFSDVVSGVALGDAEGIELELLYPDTEVPSRLTIVPDRNSAGLPTIGVGAPGDPDRAIDVTPGSPAEAAGLRSGDRVLGVTGADASDDPYVQLAGAWAAGEPIELRVERDGEELVALVEPGLDGELGPPLIGVSPPVNHVFAVRASDATAALGITADDRILEVNGTPVVRSGDIERLLVEAEGPVSLRVLRGERELELAGRELPDAEARALASDLAVTTDADSIQLVVYPDSAAEEAGVLTGDRVLRVNSERVDSFDGLKEGIVASGAAGVRLELERPGAGPDGRPGRVELTVVPRRSPVPEYGLELRSDTYLFRSEGPGEAVVLGVERSWRMIQDIWRTAQRMIFRELPSDQMGGIVMISQISYSQAERGLGSLFLFLCMLSLNLAFLNVLPIPVLDGGHLFFLLIEKIKGSPVSERVLAYSQIVGLVLILSLMVYVTFNDITRLITS